jgi:hypothetical protein
MMMFTRRGHGSGDCHRSEVHVGAWRQLLQTLRGGSAVAAGVAAGGREALWRQAVLQAYPRLAAPVLCRPAGPLSLVSGRVPGRDVLRGLAVATDERQREGSLLELEVLAGGETVNLVVRVLAVQRLPPSAPARYDVALELCDVAPESLPSLRSVLDTTRPFGQLS